MTDLRISPDLALPADFATEGVAVMGMRGSGKSNTEVRFAEVLFEAGIPWVAIDPKGDWWGVRSSGDGTAAGLPVPIFGGLHGDFILEAGMGGRIADLLVDENLTAILDVSHLSKTGGLPQFLTAFCNQLMHRHQLDPHVRTVILEEAHRYIPQTVPSELAKMKEAAASLLLEGRSFGLGCWAATQRPARLHKDVLEEVGNAFVFRIGVAATNDKKAVKGWVDHYEIGGEIVASLTKLGDGEAWVLMPQDAIVKRVQMDRRVTFDSGGTPKVGAQARRPSTLADIDQAAIKDSLADVIERAKADDPKELRQRIRALEKQLADRPTETVEVEVVREIVPGDLLAAVTQTHRALCEASDGLTAAAESIDETLNRWTTEREAKRRTAEGTLQRTEPATRPVTPRSAASPRGTPQRTTAPPQTADGDVKLGKAERLILTVLMAHNGRRTRKQLALQAGYSANGGAFKNALGALRSKGLVDKGGDPVNLLAVPDGFEVEPVPTGGAEMLDHWLTNGGLGKAEKLILSALYDHGGTMGREDLGEATGYESDGGGFKNALGRLRTLELVSRGNPVDLAPEFFE